VASAQARLIFADRRAGSDRDQSAGNIDRLQLPPFVGRRMGGEKSDHGNQRATRFGARPQTT
jgi:hypothetical protein